MAILNFKLIKVSGERKEQASKRTTVKANSSIVSVKKEKSEGGIGAYLHINFKYEVKYDPDVGEILLEGYLWYTNPKLSELMTETKERVELKNEAVQEISTAIIRESLLESLDIAKKLYLPLPIQLPKVEIKSKTVDFKKAA